MPLITGYTVLPSDWNALEAGKLLLASQAIHDLMVATSASQWARLPNGTTGQVLTATAGSAPSWKSLPRASVTDSNATQAIANTTWTSVTFNTEDYDTDTMHDTGSNTSRLVATTPGLYVVMGGVSFAANTAGKRRIRVLANGTTTPIAYNEAAAPAAGSLYIPIAGQVLLTGGQYIELQVHQDSGGSLNIERDAGVTPRFAMAWVGN